MPSAVAAYRMEPIASGATGPPSRHISVGMVEREHPSGFKEVEDMQHVRRPNDGGSSLRILQVSTPQVEP